MTESTSPKITLADFKSSREFMALTERQRKFVLRYFQDRDADASVAAAYPHVKDKIRVRNRLMADSRVTDAINLWYGVSAKEAMIASVKRDIRRARSERVRFDLKVLLCKIQGFIS